MSAPRISGFVVALLPAPREREMPLRVRAALRGIEHVLSSEIVRVAIPRLAHAVDRAEQLAFWLAMSEWAARNLAALDGAAGEGAGCGSVAS